jgi:ankyrin repeat protein
MNGLRRTFILLLFFCLVAVASVFAFSYFSQSTDLLHYAAYHGNSNLMRLILLSGVDVDLGAREFEVGPCYCHPAWVPGDTPLNAALRGGINEGSEYGQAFDLLIEAGAKVQGNPESLCLAAELGDERIVSYLLDHGAVIDASGYWGTPLVMAAGIGNVSVVNLLLEKKADIAGTDVHGRTALHWAAINEDETLLDLLLSRGSPLDIRDNEGKTPFDLAKHFGSGKAIDKLKISKGPNQ